MKARENTCGKLATRLAGETGRNSLILGTRGAWNWSAWDGRFFKGTQGRRKLTVRRRDQLKNRDTSAGRPCIGVFLNKMPLARCREVHVMRPIPGEERLLVVPLEQANREASLQVVSAQSYCPKGIKLPLVYRARHPVHGSPFGVHMSVILSERLLAEMKPP